MHNNLFGVGKTCLNSSNLPDQLKINSPKQKHGMKLPNDDHKYILRLPIGRTMKICIIFDHMFNKPTHTVAELASIGTPNTVRIGTMYGRIAPNALNCEIKYCNEIINRGRRVRRRQMSLNRSNMVGGG